MNQVFRPYLVKFIIMFINNIMIYSMSKYEHVEHLRCVLGILIREKLSKCEFWLARIFFLGHVVLKIRIIVESSKIKTIVNWKRPTTILEIHHFLRLIGYYHKSIKEFSKIAALFTKLTRKNVKFEWTDDCKRQF